MASERTLEEIYRRLLERYGHQYWWPADSPFEVVVGAILTQSTAWTNVEKAIASLKEARALSPSSLRRLDAGELARLVRPSGYYNAKARKLKAFMEHLEGYGDSLEAMFAGDIRQLRQELLSIHGIGPETADSIILYAARKPVFVVDAYTHRIMERLGMHPGGDDYAALQAVFMGALPHDVDVFNEYHALFVRHGKEACRKNTPLCRGCCLQELCLLPGKGWM